MIKTGQGFGATPSGMTRRALLRMGAVGVSGWGWQSLAGAQAQASGSSAADKAVIVLLMVGGPSQLETWDPKPDAPAEIRGPHGSIATRIPGVRINEHLPRLAQRMDRLALIRSVHHDAAPIHETGFQLLQTGRLASNDDSYPNLGSWASHRLGHGGSLPTSVILPGPIGNTGVTIPHGQSAGWLGSEHESFVLGGDPSSASFDPKDALDRARRSHNLSANRDEARSLLNFAGASARRSGRQRNPFDLSAEREDIRETYGKTRFGESCLMARRLVESGVRMVTVNMFDSVFNQITWDCHGRRPFSTLDDYAETVLPTFDRAFSALLDDLQRTGLLDSTMVLAAGEFGRSPKLNACGGRDHWPDVWSVALAGGGIRGGQVIGTSDAMAANPADRPVRPEELAATLLNALDIDPAQAVPHPDGRPIALLEDARPIAELFA